MLIHINECITYRHMTSLVKSKWINSDKTMIPDYWKPGSNYETDIHIP